MSTISSFQAFSCSIYQTNTSKVSQKPNLFGRVNFERNPICSQKFSELIWTKKCKITRVMSSEEDALVPESVVQEDVPVVEQSETVTIPVSPADKLIMFFQAEGTMNELAIPSVTQALEGTEGISDLKVGISEGIATVELTKQTTIQATGVASGLLEAVQGAGFRLNTLNLSFEDEELLTV
ncbi:uncharacterized protein LOC141605690 [Silene latifolia]|uniref:uncharacterized protein LOC141605690 n=1 Tax=Silene latifolia TaxID=37657 RepID=UPI003D76AD5A